METEKTYISINGELQELTGSQKKAYFADLEETNARIFTLEAQAEAKRQARIDAITKLGQASGLTTEEIESILNI